jgi:outer membrane lipopolysaccharide assembly protein LptE/RlpB
MGSVGTARKPWDTRSTDGERIPGGSRPALLALAALAALSGCGYSFSSRSNPDVSSIAIPLFENQTLEKGIEDRLTDEISQAFLDDKKLRVVKEKNADSVLRGRIERYDRTPYSYDADRNVQEYKVDLTLSVLYENRKKNRPIWEDTAMHAWGTYSVSPLLPGGIEDEAKAQERAIAKAAEDILVKTVKGW